MSEKKSQVSKIKEGTYLSETQYYKVVEVNGSSVQVENERGFRFGISHGIVEEGSYSADQYNSEQLVTRTQLIEIFSNVGDTVFTVNFNKQPKAEDINAAIESANNGKFKSIAEIKKVVKNAYKGEERTLTGYLVKTETGFGRSTVIDLQQPKGDNPNHDGRLRQVDHRTLNFLIYKNVKYIVK